MKSKETTYLEALVAYAEGYAKFAMKNIGHMPATMLAVSAEGCCIAIGLRNF